MATPTDEVLVERLLAEDGDMVVIETKMVRGSTHDKDRTTVTAALPKDGFAEELSELRTAQQTDMTERRAYDPDEESLRGGEAEA